MASRSKAVAVIPVGEYAVLGQDAERVAAVIKENMGDKAGVSLFELDGIKVPSGETQFWQVPTLDGPQAEKEIVGVIMAWQDVRAYYATSYDDSGGGTPPDCRSADGLEGSGSPGGVCANCSMNAYDEETGRKPCGEYRVLFMVRPKDFLPVVAWVPPSSLKPIRSHFRRLASEGVRYWETVTSLGLEKSKSKRGQVYNEIVPKLVERIEGDLLARVEVYHDNIAKAVGV